MDLANRQVLVHLERQMDLANQQVLGHQKLILHLVQELAYCRLSLNLELLYLNKDMKQATQLK
jgi:hypothetical protein